MRKVGNSLKRISREAVIQSNAGFLSSPEVIFRVMTNSFHKADGMNLLGHRDTPHTIKPSTPVGPPTRLLIVKHSADLQDRPSLSAARWLLYFAADEPD